MKKIYFRTSEENYTYIKEVIGFENIDSFLNSFVNLDKEHTEKVNHGSKN